MKFIVDGTTYEAPSLDLITGDDVEALMAETGIGLGTLARRLADLAPQEDGTDAVDPLESGPHLRAFLAYLWLSMRHGGEAIPFEDVRALRISDIDFDASETPVVREANDVELDPPLPV